MRRDAFAQKLARGTSIDAFTLGAPTARADARVPKKQILPGAGGRLSNTADEDGADGEDTDKDGQDDTDDPDCTPLPPS